jgi:magnesium transporter
MDQKLQTLLDTARKLIRRGAYPNLSKVVAKSHPADIAHLFRYLEPKEQRILFSLIEDPEAAASVLAELDPDTGAELLEQIDRETITAVLQEMPCDDAVELIRDMPEELAQEILGSMQEERSEEIEQLLQYDEETAGGIMSTEVFALGEDLTVGEAIAALQQAGDVEMVFYVYVVDDNGRLTGVLSLRQLLLKRPETRLEDIMETDVIRVATETDQEEVAQLVASCNLLAVPVVDPQNNLVGVITVDDVIDIIKEEATEDILRLAGVNTDDRVFNPPVVSAKKRAPWLVVNLVTAFLAALVVSRFETVISRFALLAVFMPIVPSMGGNAANQTLTVIVRGIALGELSWRKANPWLGAVLALAMIGNLMVAAVVGTLIPLLLRRLSVDPALASSVLVTTATDVAGFLLFLGLGAAFLVPPT